MKGSFLPARDGSAGAVDDRKLAQFRMAVAQRQRRVYGHAFLLELAHERRPQTPRLAEDQHRLARVRPLPRVHTANYRTPPRGE